VSEVFATGLALIAAVMAFVSMRRTKALRARLDALEHALFSPQAKGLEDQPPQETPEPQTVVAPEQTGGQGTPWTGRGAVSEAPKTREIRTSPGHLAGFGAWLRANWIYPVAGAALVMAAVFLVQYSIESGLLSPSMRIALAVFLGAGLIATGEGIRRRWGDEDGPARFVPSTLSGAGIFALLAAVLAAFHLYGLLSQPMALIALAAVAFLAMTLGWVHGPFLASLGVVSGTAAPFVLGDSSASIDMLYAYFGAVALLGLGIDGFRRWGWVSALAVSLPQIGGLLILVSGAGPVGMILLVLVVAIMSMTIPFGTLVPAAQGPTLWQNRRLSPLMVPAIALALGAGILIFLNVPFVNILALIALALVHTLWTARAPALADLALIPTLAIPAAIIVNAVTVRGSVSAALGVAPWMTVLAVALAGLVGVAQIRRSEITAGGTRAFWAVLAVAFPMGTFISFELFWGLSTRIPGFTWAATAMALAAGYVVMALWVARRDTGQGLRLGLSVMAAFTMISLSLMITLSLAALTVALAVLMGVAAAMDKRFNIPVVGWFLVLSSMTLGYRIVISPGLSWLLGYPGTGGASAMDVVISLAAALSGPAVALWLIRDLPKDKTRDWSRTCIETGLTGMVPIAIAVITTRFFSQDLQPHALAGLQATVLMALSWVHARRAALVQGDVWMRRFRTGISLLFGVACVVSMSAALVILTPLMPIFIPGSRVSGWPLFNDLLVAYAFPALLLLGISFQTPGRAGVIGRGIALGLLAHWTFLAIRHTWTGTSGMALSLGFKQGELYTYTVALLVAGAASLALALRMGQNGLRIAGLALIGAAAAKAFLIDASGLTGLLRAGAFLALGVSLVGLAWLNAWVAAQIKTQDAKQ